MLPIFNKLPLDLGLTDLKKRSELQHKISTEIEFCPSYFLLLVGATIVVTLGLLIDSSAVVIGAMIMAPLYWPMLGVALGIALGDYKILQQALKLLLFSIILGLLISWLTSSLIPLAEITREISLRISPTILDLLIALTCSVIGVLAVYDPHISSSVVGVVLSLALLPPLATAGIGLSFKDQRIFQGGLQFFVANMIAVIFVGVMTLYVLKVRPRKKEESHRFALGLSSSLFVLIMLAIPLTIYFQQALLANQAKKNLKTELIAQMHKIDSRIRTNQIEIEFVPDFNGEVNIKAVSYLPEDVFLTELQQNQMVQELSSLVPGYVDLQLSLVNTLMLRQEKENATVQEMRWQIQRLAQEILDQKMPGATVFQVEITQAANQDLSLAELIVLMPEDKTKFTITLAEFKDFLQTEIDQQYIGAQFSLRLKEFDSE